MKYLLLPELKPGWVIAFSLGVMVAVVALTAGLFFGLFDGYFKAIILLMLGLNAMANGRTLGKDKAMNKILDEFLERQWLLRRDGALGRRATVRQIAYGQLLQKHGKQAILRHQRVIKAILDDKESIVRGME